jgi:hypothetical protein
MVPVVQQMGADCACHVNLNAQRSASLTDLSTGLATGAFNADDVPDIDLTDAATEQVSSVAMRIYHTAIMLGLSLATSGLWGGDNPS